MSNPLSVGTNTSPAPEARNALLEAASSSLADESRYG